MTNTCTISGTSVVCSMMKLNGNTVGYRVCSVERCGNKHFGKGYCSKHFTRLRRTGRLELSTRRNGYIHGDIGYIPLTKGQTAIVDASMFDAISQYNWYAHQSSSVGKHTFYACRRMNDKIITMHSMVIDCPKGKERDHINRNGLDNRAANLRVCNKTDNVRNTTGKHGASKYKGISWYKRDKVWTSQIWMHNKKIHIGRFAEEQDAAIAYDMFALMYYGSFAFTNLPKKLYLDWIADLTEDELCDLVVSTFREGI